MSTAAGVCTGIFVILLALTFLGLAVPNLVLGIVGLLSGILILAAGLPWTVRQ